MKTIGVLTSSRADYGIYLPLIRELANHPDYSLKLIVFGSHLSPYHGNTVDFIKSDGFSIAYTIQSMLLHDTEDGVSSATGLTMLKFADFWENHKKEFDIVFCLGDRYEMFAAVYSGVPFGIRFAHIHGGETTLGAIDNTYRHAISLASSYHFTSIEAHSQRVREITKSEKVFTVGSLSLDNLKTLSLLNISELKSRWDIDFSRPTILVTVHPETVSASKNYEYATVCHNTFKELQLRYQLVITMPNADTLGTTYRNAFFGLKNEAPANIKIIENFGIQGYFSAMKYSKFLIGNTSSGIIEAATFKKYVINLGDRQKGRLSGKNVYNCSFSKEEILRLVNKVELLGDYNGENIYHLGGAATKILTILKRI